VHRRHGEAHGANLTPEYRAWKEMIKRCENPRCERFSCYGGRGIRVCDDWRHSYETFLGFIGRRPSPHHSIHRIDNDGPYAPGNVEWQTRKHQASHTSRNVALTIRGETACVAEWCDRLGVPRPRVYQRIATGWDPARALFAPAGARRNAA
jgi:hypothetical protein